VRPSAREHEALVVESQPVLRAIEDVVGTLVRRGQLEREHEAGLFVARDLLVRARMLAFRLEGGARYRARTQRVRTSPDNWA
jgi:hypothetical protein